MTQINSQMVQSFEKYLGFYEGHGYVYQVGAELFVYNGEGLNKIAIR